MASANQSLWDNPLGTDGFEFVEYAAPDPATLGRLFDAWARHDAPTPGSCGARAGPKAI